MTSTPPLIDIISLFGLVIVLVYLRSYLNHLPFSLALYCSEAIHTVLKKMVASLFQNG